MRFAVEAWSPAYGTSIEMEAPEPADGQVNPFVEALTVGEWAPRAVGADPPEVALFVDGVQRRDAVVWITGDDGRTRQGVCASYAAGVLRCAGGRARLERAEVRRELFSPAPEAEPIETPHGAWRPFMTGEGPEALAQALMQRMRDLEVRIANEIPTEPGACVVIDGHLSGRQNVGGAVGYVKTHHRSYLPEDLEAVVARLSPGERTPLFHVQGSLSRLCWYLRLPGGGSGHPWAGIVRCEIGADRARGEAVAVADRVSAALPRFASSPHKEPRAPQNLYPIGGLERELRRRLGDARLLERALRSAAMVPAG